MTVSPALLVLLSRKVSHLFSAWSRCLSPCPLLKVLLHESALRLLRSEARTQGLPTPQMSLSPPPTLWPRSAPLDPPPCRAKRSSAKMLRSVPNMFHSVPKAIADSARPPDQARQKAPQTHDTM